MPSNLERAFLWHWQHITEGPKLTPEHRFYSERRWRFDFAHLESKVAVELEGGTWTNGRHNRAAGFQNDCEKYNYATSFGWSVFRLTGDMLKEDPDFWCGMIKTAIEAK